jgi:hypothetical protein
MCRVKKAQEQGRTIQKRIYIYKKRPVSKKKEYEAPLVSIPVADFLQTFD